MDFTLEFKGMKTQELEALDKALGFQRSQGLCVSVWFDLPTADPIVTFFRGVGNVKA